MNPNYTKYYISELTDQVRSLPSLAAQIAASASDPDCDIYKLSKLILSDNAMTMRFMALANSPALSPTQKIVDLRGALVRLGMRRIRNVALLMGMHDMIPSTEPSDGLDLLSFWQYNLAVASCAQGLAWQQDSVDCDEAWLVGILHGIGIAILNREAPEDFQRALRQAAVEESTLTRAEFEIFGFHHGELGGKVLRKWNLPLHFAQAVEAYPEGSPDDELTDEARTLASVLRQAIAVARAIGFDHNGDGTEITPLDTIAIQAGLPGPAVESLAAKVDRNLSEIAELIGLDHDRDPFAKAWAATKDQIIHLGLMGFDESMACQGFENELTVARDIQMRLLPEQLPAIPGFSFGVGYIPCLHLSGDCYDFFPLSDGTLGVVVADVSGKGMPASLLASNLQASLRALAKAIPDPADLLAAVNAALYETTDPERFATLFLGCLDHRNSVLRYVSAGHNPPLLLREDASVEWLDSTGLPLGILPETEYDTLEIKLAPGDVLVAFTDGITEATNDQDVEFTEQGLLEVVAPICQRDPEEIVRITLEAVLDHVGKKAPGQSHPSAPAPPDDAGQGAGADDDLTLIVIRKSETAG